MEGVNMSQPSPTQEASQAVSQRALEQIQMRTANGEFGVPPNSELLNRAWAELFQSEMRGRPRKDIYNDVCGLWNDRGWLNDNNKVLLSGHTQKDVTIPKNTKVLVMKNNPQEGTRQPNAKILYVTHED
jgi:hypothetical protein